MISKKQVVKDVQEKVNEFENSLADAKDLINMLKQSGESTIDLETQYNQAVSKLKRIKNAFKE